MGTVTNRQIVKKNHPKSGNRQTGSLGIFLVKDCALSSRFSGNYPIFLGAGTFA